MSWGRVSQKHTAVQALIPLSVFIAVVYMPLRPSPEESTPDGEVEQQTEPQPEDHPFTAQPRLSTVPRYEEVQQEAQPEESKEPEDKPEEPVEQEDTTELQQSAPQELSPEGHPVREITHRGSQERLQAQSSTVQAHEPQHAEQTRTQIVHERTRERELAEAKEASKPEASPPSHSSLDQQTELRPAAQKLKDKILGQDKASQGEPIPSSQSDIFQEMRHQPFVAAAEGKPANPIMPSAKPKGRVSCLLHELNGFLHFRLSHFGCETDTISNGNYP